MALKVLRGLASEALHRARMMKAGEELELEKRFRAGAAGAPASALTNAPASSAEDRQAAKVKALEQQAGPAN